MAAQHIYFNDAGQLLWQNRVVGHIAISDGNFDLTSFDSIISSGQRANELTINDIKPKTPDELRKQVEFLCNLPKQEQRSIEWHQMRETRLTASDLAGAIGDSKYEKPFDILVKKCGKGKPFKGSPETRWGVKYEPVAASLYEQRNKTKLFDFGLIPHASIPYLGASPDGITADGIMLEIKCPYRRKIDGVIPHHYYLQMQLQLEVCDLEYCDFAECKFSEYPNVRAFLNDHQPGQHDRLLTGDGQDKGILIEIRNCTSNVLQFKYCPVDDSLAAAIRWADAEEQRITQSSPHEQHLNSTSRTYWKLVKYSCVPVKRDRDWFQKTLPIISRFWRDVCYYRTQPLEILYTDHNKSPPLSDVISDGEPEDPHKGNLETNTSSIFVESDDESAIGNGKNLKSKQISKDNSEINTSNIFLESDEENSMKDSEVSKTDQICKGMKNIKLTRNRSKTTIGKRKGPQLSHSPFLIENDSE